MKSLSEIRADACVDEFIKISGVLSESINTGLGLSSSLAGLANPSTRVESAVGLAGSAIPMGIGYLKGGHKTKESMIKQDKRGLSNFLLPFASQYRMGRRLATDKSIQVASAKEIEKEKFNKKIQTLNKIK